MLASDDVLLLYELFIRLSQGHKPEENTDRHRCGLMIFLYNRHYFKNRTYDDPLSE